MPNLHSWARLGIFAAFIFSVSACGVVDYDFHKENLFAPPKKQKDIGILRFHYGDTAETLDMRLRRVKGGYAIQTPLYETSEGSFIHFTTSKTKESGDFIGFQGKLQF